MADFSSFSYSSSHSTLTQPLPSQLFTVFIHIVNASHLWSRCATIPCPSVLIAFTLNKALLIHSHQTCWYAFLRENQPLDQQRSLRVFYQSAPCLQKQGGELILQQIYSEWEQQMTPPFRTLRTAKMKERWKYLSQLFYLYIFLFIYLFSKSPLIFERKNLKLDYYKKFFEKKIGVCFG